MICEMRSGRRPFAKALFRAIQPACLAAVLMLFASCSSSDPQSGEIRSVLLPNTGPIPIVDLSRDPVVDGGDPSTRAGAASDFLDCRDGIVQGIAAADFGIPPGASDPDVSVERFVLEELFVLPGSGYTAAGEDEGRRLYTHSVDGEAKVAIVVADRSIIPIDADGEWGVEALASCDPSEFDSSFDELLAFEVWLDADGERMPSAVIKTYQGDDHCDQESATLLSLEGALFVADPRGVLGDVSAATDFDDDTELPADAVDSGYRHESRKLWLSADGSIAYMVTDDKVEAWPLAANLPNCA